MKHNVRRLAGACALAAAMTGAPALPARAAEHVLRPPQVVDLNIADLNGDGEISEREIEVALHGAQIPGPVIRVHDDGRVDTALNVAWLDRAGRRLKWVSADLGFVGASFPDGRVYWQGHGWAKSRGWTVLDLESGAERFSTESVQWLHAHGQFEMLHASGLLQGSTGVAFVDQVSGRVRWIKKAKELGLDSIVISTDGGIVASERHLVRLRPGDGSISWEIRDLDKLIGKVSYVSDEGRAAGRPGDKDVKGVALFDASLGQLRFTTADVSPTRRDSMRQYGIRDIGRFYGNGFIDHIIAVRSRSTRQGTRPLAVVLYPSADWNRAFAINNLDDLMRRYDVLYYEIDGDATFLQALDEVRALRESVALAIIGGHATAQVLSFGGSDPRGGGRAERNRTLDLEDESELGKRAGVFAGSTILIDACLTGAGGSGENNIANLVARTIGLGAAVLFAPMGVANTLLMFDEKGGFLAPNFFGKLHPVVTYRLTPAAPRVEGARSGLS